MVWSLSLYLGWESFHALQVPGFLLLLMGTSLYNEVIRLPGLFDYGPDVKPTAAAATADEEGGTAEGQLEEPLLGLETADDHEAGEPDASTSTGPRRVPPRVADQPTYFTSAARSLRVTGLSLLGSAWQGPPRRAAPGDSIQEDEGSQHRGDDG